MTGRIQAAAAGLVVAAPVAVAGAYHVADVGLAASLGAMMMTGRLSCGRWGAVLAQFAVVAAALLAAELFISAPSILFGGVTMTLWHRDPATGVVTATHWLPPDHWPDERLALVAALAGCIVTYSRGVTEPAGRFIPFLFLGIGAASDQFSHIEALFGAIFAVLPLLALASFTKSQPRQPSLTHRQRLRRLIREIRIAEFWSYPVRLGVAVAVAGALRQAFPDHHFFWIALTIAILLPRRSDAAPLRLLEGAASIAVGVVLAWQLQAWALPVWALAAPLFALAAGRPWLQARSDALPNAAMTPLVILLMDAGAPVNGGVLVDRLVATLLGVALVAAANVTWRRIAHG